nr:immunoglobulin light chain junction region [Macaca mulatta]
DYYCQVYDSTTTNNIF